MGKFWIGVLVAVVCASAASPEKGFTALFDGKTLDGWELTGKKGSGYVVEDGLLVCPADGGGNLFTKKEYGNFVLRFEFRLQEGSNNGIGIRSPLTGDAAYKGMEIQILDDGAPRYQGKIKPAQYHGSIYDVIPARQGFKKPTGQWNTEEIIANSRHITVRLNGTVIVDANLDSVTDPAVLQKHPGLARTSGHIGLLGHGTRVDFRNLRIKELR
ncbi:MAG: DUF1080 domain-containing protein [Bryobacteraceae bacterium]